VAENKAFAEKFDFPYRLLSDPERKAGLAYGACSAPDAAHARRLTYVVAADGKILQAIDTTDPAGQAAALLKSLD